MRPELVPYSRLLSHVLRHRPESVGVKLDKAGWTEVAGLILAVQRKHPEFDMDTLVEVVDTNEKKRFALSPDKLKIRASQGHSVGVELGLNPVRPPAVLFHGTVERNLASIKKQGLLRCRRNHVHLSADVETATRVGARRGRPVILTIDSAHMSAAGVKFFCSDNNVWLCEHVSPEFIRFPK